MRTATRQPDHTLLHLLGVVVAAEVQHPHLNPEHREPQPHQTPLTMDILVGSIDNREKP